MNTETVLMREVNAYIRVYSCFEMVYSMCQIQVSLRNIPGIITSQKNRAVNVYSHGVVYVL